MDTTTLMVVIGCGVLVKTLAFVGFVVRRDRRQRRELAAAGEAAQAAVERAALLAAPWEGTPSADLSHWRVQWAEPGVLLVENAHESEAARDVEVAATLTTGCGLVASLVRHERFVGTGACFTARFAELEEWLSHAVLLEGAERRTHLTCSLDLALTWMSKDGLPQSETRLAQPVVPVPDLVLEAA